MVHQAGDPQRLDVVIFGGGATGLWLLDDLVRHGYATVLLEATELGSGQTVASQGIIHGGLKYTLDGLLRPSARAIRDMPGIWRRCLAGESEPRLTGTKLRAEFCHLWQTRKLRSRAAMFGARAGLQVGATVVSPDARPPVLRACPGVVARLDEQVIEPDSFLADLAARHVDRLGRIDLDSGLEFDHGEARGIELIRLIDPATGAPLDLRPGSVVFAAGAGNASLRRRVGCAEVRMQRRTLHMVVARGALPTLNGHCVDGMRTRATITTTRDHADRTVWQIGGQIAEDGVAMPPDALIRHARAELEAILPGVDLTAAEWTTYHVDRAEAARGGRRPAHEEAFRERNIVTGWPTKLALVPRLVERIRSLLPPPEGGDGTLGPWPRPRVAAPPWEEDDAWTHAH